jgi:hypothetical protein
MIFHLCPTSIGGGVKVPVGKVSVGGGGGVKVYVGYSVEVGFGVSVGCGVSVGIGVSVGTGSGVSVDISFSSVGVADLVGIRVEDTGGVRVGIFGTYNFCPTYSITEAPIQFLS